ncbi:pSer/pThr/pTyr-binding forkhead associated (FHA) protein [Streptosporangium becharense]|uniref:PSer/pThr/pTyr-binding forkhead associated (FHA) protein n=1 Tax=Streptosporangium becharense TaxID=1816182 RepID=A0A7W9IHJ8_9ACTN|nr:FHA domain-containing protein [Streptosporangium becharense]MBB2908803.1 pSer/pThr/pTyr-binding forkhead associated (FHA) protein [Streptosporangium becharense]MBB5820179.1 pSer/pThr/pTyr-binding forkhead associated (FHA) protein [Streptosporangium becharense]
MSELTLLLIRLAFLAVLWFFVIAAVGVIRTDLFGSRTPAAVPVKAPKPVKPASKPRKGEPRQMVVVGGPLQGTIIPLTEVPITIGRASDATLVVSDDYASSRHARLFPQDGQWIVEDLGSTNGTYLDRSKVTRPTPVPLGVPIRIGKTVIELRK